MKRVLLALLISATPALADGDGVDIVPFNTPGGQVSGVVTIDNTDGTATVSGQVQGVPFTCLGKATQQPDGSWEWDILLSDADTLIKKKSWIPIKFRFWGKAEDGEDGDDSDDSVGAIDVRSQTGVGKGSVQLSG
jgi:hypothetical protein